MLEPPQVAQSPERRTAVIHVTIPREQIRTVMGPGIQELTAELGAQGIAPAGAWFTHHLRMDPEVFDFEIGVPVDAAVAAAGRVRPGRLPAATIVRAVYVGPYEGLGEAWGELNAWMEAAGHRPAAELWECYLTGPESGSDPAGWRTELNRPLAG